jgi:BRO family protein
MKMNPTDSWPLSHKVGNRSNPEAPAFASAVIPAAASFNFQIHRVRVIQMNGVEHFVALDLAPILGFGNARQAVRTHVPRADRDTVQVVDAIGRTHNVLAVNESGVYALVFGSSKPEAKVFKHWVTSEVLPFLRKTGRFEVGHGVPTLLQNVTAILRGRGAGQGPAAKSNCCPPGWDLLFPDRQEVGPPDFTAFRLRFGAIPWP